MDKEQFKQKARDIGFKMLTGYWCTLAAASAVAVLTTTVLPERFYSSPLDDYLKERGLGPIPHAASNIRVYHRYNPLALVHESARKTYKEERGADRVTDSVTDRVVAVFRMYARYPLNLLDTAYDSFNRSPTDAHAFPESTQGSCFISPPQDVTVKEFIEFMGELPTGPGVAFHVPPQTGQALEQYILNHEVAHCGQDPELSRKEKEADADLKGLAQLKEQGYAPDVVKTTTAIVRHTRAVAGVLSLGQGDHSTAGALERGRPGDSEKLALERLGELLVCAESVKHLGKPLFSEGDRRSLMAQPVAVTLYPPMVAAVPRFMGPYSSGAARRYLEGAEYFNKLSGGKLLAPVEKIANRVREERQRPSISPRNL